MDIHIDNNNYNLNCHWIDEYHQNQTLGISSPISEGEIAKKTYYLKRRASFHVDIVHWCRIYECLGPGVISFEILIKLSFEKLNTENSKNYKESAANQYDISDLLQRADKSLHDEF